MIEASNCINGARLDSVGVLDSWHARTVMQKLTCCKRSNICITYFKHDPYPGGLVDVSTDKRRSRIVPALEGFGDVIDPFHPMVRSRQYLRQSPPKFYCHSHSQTILHSSTMFECNTCTQEFWYQDECDDHMDDERHWIECETCNRTFRTQPACNQHMNAINHWAPSFECETCTSTFSSQHGVNNHMNAKGHWLPTVRCETCPTKFQSEQAAENHMRAMGHYKNYCQECRRSFMNTNCLRQVGQLT